MQIKVSNIVLCGVAVSPLASSVASSAPTPAVQIANGTFFNATTGASTPCLTGTALNTASIVKMDESTIKPHDVAIGKLADTLASAATAADYAASSETSSANVTASAATSAALSTGTLVTVSELAVKFLAPAPSQPAPTVDGTPVETPVNKVLDQEASSCKNNTSTQQDSPWSFDLGALIGVIFGFAQTVLAIFPAMVAWQFLMGHIDAGAAHVIV